MVAERKLFHSKNGLARNWTTATADHHTQALSVLKVLQEAMVTAHIDTQLSCCCLKSWHLLQATVITAANASQHSAVHVVPSGSRSPYNKRNKGKYELQCTSNAYNLQAQHDQVSIMASKCRPIFIRHKGISLMVQTAAVAHAAYHSKCCSTWCCGRFLFLRNLFAMNLQQEQVQLDQPLLCSCDVGQQ